MDARATRHAPDAPISVYEVHLGFLDASVARRRRRHDVGRSDRSHHPLRRRPRLHAHRADADHGIPFGGSWGYRRSACSRRPGASARPRALRASSTRRNQAGIGIILDWVPAHFPTDPHGPARASTAPRCTSTSIRAEGFHHDWNTYIYNFGRREVQGFLIASALHWLEHFHVDALRVDAVASMLYRDYSRPADAWVPNVYGGRENLEAVGFLRISMPSCANAAPARS